MATGQVKSWNGTTGLITSQEHDQQIHFHFADFRQNFEPSVGDCLKFKVKKIKDKDTKEIVLHAKKIKYANFDYSMNPGAHTTKQSIYNIVMGFLSIIVIAGALLIGSLFLK